MSKRSHRKCLPREMEFFSSQPWWSANRDNISKVVRESEKVENR